MTDYYENCRWFLRHGGEDQPFVEVSKDEWLQAEYDAGFHGGRMIRPSTGGFGSGAINGIIVYGKEAVPAGAVELIAEPPTYEWGWQQRPFGYGRWGAVRESYEDNDADAETRARTEVDACLRARGYGTARVVRRRVVRHDWEGVQ